MTEWPQHAVPHPCSSILFPLSEEVHHCSFLHSISSDLLWCPPHVRLCTWFRGFSSDQSRELSQHVPKQDTFRWWGMLGRELNKTGWGMSQVGSSNMGWGGQGREWNNEMPQGKGLDSERKFHAEETAKTQSLRWERPWYAEQLGCLSLWPSPTQQLPGPVWVGRCRVLPYGCRVSGGCILRCKIFGSDFPTLLSPSPCQTGEQDAPHSSSIIIWQEIITCIWLERRIMVVSSWVPAVCYMNCLTVLPHFIGKAAQWNIVGQSRSRNVLHWSF